MPLQTWDIGEVFSISGYVYRSLQAVSVKLKKTLILFPIYAYRPTAWNRRSGLC